ncbi:MAG TPA: hypothetical protein K8V35_04260 [Aliicoccus persicus]|uniref:YpoC-like domain-containing protein n=1 Tax=Aliicoccus persicus TaxID=930138 RepID=A0A921JBX2_9STAP|nr:hypothetical protein [Aliicoccus persicus]
MNEEFLDILNQSWDHLLEDSTVDVDKYIMIMDQLIEESDSSVIPINYDERVEYIKAQPTRYHARVQLRELIDEFIKKYAVWKVKQA